jgi:hypothetical protein
MGLVSNSWERPADLRCISWKDNQDAWFDVTVISPHSQDYRNEDLNKFNGALLKAERNKTKRAGPAAQALGVEYIPMSFSTFGGAGDQVASTMRMLAHLAGARNGVRSSAYLLKFRAKIAATIAMHNARAFESQAAFNALRAASL